MRILGERGLYKDQKSGKELREEDVPIQEPRGQLRVLQPEQVLQGAAGRAAARRTPVVVCLGNSVFICYLLSTCYSLLYFVDLS